MPGNKLTREQIRELKKLDAEALGIRACQLLSVGLGIYGPAFDGRTWHTFVIMLAIALVLQTQLPALPGWLHDMRENQPGKE